jgi:hypothetical protein
MQYVNVICWIKDLLLSYGVRNSPYQKTLVFRFSDFRFSNFKPNQELRLIKDVKVIWQNMSNLSKLILSSICYEVKQGTPETLVGRFQLEDGVNTKL